jgi:hypothetical protein
VQRRFEIAGLRVAVVVMLGWHAASALPNAIEGWSRYRPTGTGLYVWAVYAVVGVVAAVVVRRGGGTSAALPVTASAVLLAGVALVAATSPTRTPVDPYSWAFASSGWFALVAMWRRPIGNLAAFFVANALTALAVLMASGQLDRVTVARLAATSYGVSVLELSVLAGSRALAALAGRTAAAQDAQARVANRQIAARAAHDARRGRFEIIRRTATDLLSGLAGNHLDLTEPVTQQRMRIAVSRLRRLIVETDDVPDRLLHELRACADAAERRGVEVDLQAPVGTVDILPVTARRALAEPVIQVLAGTRTRARITVVAQPSDVTVAIVADAPDVALPGGEPDVDMDVARDNEGGWLWVQSRWTA